MSKGLKQKKSQLPFKVKAVEDKDNVLRFIGSDESPDRHGDIVVAEGWDLKNYKNNPVFLWGHDYDELPIGKAIDVYVDKKTKSLIFDIEFAVEEYPFAATVYKLYKGGYLNAVSVGFMVKDFSIEDDVWYLEECELLELSAVTVPANPNALMAGINKGLFSTDEMKELETLISKEHRQTKKANESQESKSTLNKEEEDMQNAKMVVELELDTSKAEAKIKELMSMMKDLEVEETEEVVEETVEEVESVEEEIVEEVKEEVVVEEEVVEEVEVATEEKSIEQEESAEEVVEEEVVEETAKEDNEEVIEVNPEEVKEEEIVAEEKSLRDGILDAIMKNLKEEK